jgi:hypothetical protein
LTGPDFALSGLEASFGVWIDYDRVPPEETGYQWLACHCSCEVDGFQAQFPLSVTRQDLEYFEIELTRLSTGEASDVEIENLECDFKLRLTLQRTGAVTVAGWLTPGYISRRATLNFEFNSDLASVDTAVRRIAAAIAAVRKFA